MRPIVIASVLVAGVVGENWVAAADRPVKVALRLIDVATVEVVVANQAEGPLDVAIDSYFVLGGSAQELRTGSMGLESFWSPFDLSTGRPIPPDPKPREPPRLTLGGKASRQLTIRLQDLKWARRVSNLYPDEELDQMVPSGRYPLICVLKTYDEPSKHRSRGFWSDSVTVEVPRK